MNKIVLLQMKEIRNVTLFSLSLNDFVVVRMFSSIDATLVGAFGRVTAIATTLEKTTTASL